jgi:hypothetical protein
VLLNLLQPTRGDDEDGVDEANLPICPGQLASLDKDSRLRWSQRPPRYRRMRSPRVEVAFWSVFLVFSTAGVAALAGLYSLENTPRFKTGIAVLDALPATLQRPAVAFIAAFALAMVMAWCFRRLWLEWLAWSPGPIHVRQIDVARDLPELDPAALTTEFRRHLGHLRLRSPATVPAATPATDFLDALADAKLETRNPLGSLVGILRAAKPRFAYEVRASLRKPPGERRYSISVEATRLPNETITTVARSAATPEAAVAQGAHAVIAGVLPRTKRCRTPWSGWHRYTMPPDLPDAYERAAELTEQRRYDEALDLYYRALERDPLNVDVRLQIGFVQEKLGLFLDAMAMYASARRVGTTKGKGLYDRRARRERRATAEIAHYRMCSLLAGRHLAAQWRRLADKDEQPQREAQRKALRDGLTPIILGMLVERDLLEQTYSHPVLRPPGEPPWRCGDAKELLGKEAESCEREEEMSPAPEPYYQLRKLFLELALQELRALERSVPRVHLPPNSTRLTRRAVKLGIALTEPRKEFVDGEPWRSSVKYPRLGCPKDMLDRVAKLERFRSFRRWSEHYNAACVLAIPLLVDDDRREDESGRKGEALADLAVERLKRALAAADTSMIAARRDWILSEDPDLEGLRSYPAFKAFEMTYLPSTVHTPTRTPQVHRWEMSAHVGRLLAQTAERWEQEWYRRARKIRVLPGADVVAEWWADDEAAWRLVHEVATNGRHWPARFDLIHRMSDWSERYGFAVLDSAVPRFGLGCLKPGAAANREEIEGDVKRTIDGRDIRLEDLDRDAPAGCGGRRGTLQKQIHEIENALRLRDNGARPPDRHAMARVCNDLSALWQSLRERLEEPR